MDGGLFGCHAKRDRDTETKDTKQFGTEFSSGGGFDIVPLIQPPHRCKHEVNLSTGRELERSVRERVRERVR